MRYRGSVQVVVSLLVLGLPVCAQTVSQGKAASASQAPASPAASSVAPDAPVITIDGICSSAPWSIAKAAAATSSTGGTNPGTAGSSTGNTGGGANRCQLEITRAEFEKLAAVITPNTLPQSDLQLAHVYSDLLVSALRAHEQGLDQDPHLEDILSFTYVQVMARAMNNQLQEGANKRTAADFDKYYKEHAQEFEQVELLQISVPKRREQANEPGPVVVDADAGDAAMKLEADKIHSRAVAGEDFDKLQQAAYTAAGRKDTPPVADMGQVTRAEVGQFQEQIFALPVGQVSEITSGPKAWHIVKVVSKRMMPPEQAKKRLITLRAKEALESLKNSAMPQFNDAYFRNPNEPQPNTSPEWHK